MVALAHPTILETRSFPWPDEAACAAFAARLARAPSLWPSTFITLEGPLGAGKTTLARHLLRALGIEGRIKSPTYALMEPYAVGGHAASHFDFYRLRDAREFDDAGLRDIFAAPGLKLAEWPDRAAPHLPVPDWRVEIEPADVASNGNARHVTVHAFTPHGVELLASSS